MEEEEENTVHVVDKSLHISQEIPVIVVDRSLQKSSSWTGFKRTLSEKFFQITNKTEGFRKTFSSPWIARQRTTDAHNLVDGYSTNAFSRSLFWVLQRTGYFLINIFYFLLFGLIGVTIIFFVENRDNTNTSFLDALFMTVSSLSVTGLTVINVSKMALASKITILILMQLGGIVMNAILPVLIRRENLRKVAFRAQMLKEAEEMKRNTFQSSSSANLQNSAVFSMKTEIPQIQEIEKLTDDQLLDLWSYQFEYEMLGHLMRAVISFTFFIYLFFFGFLSLWCSYYSPTFRILKEKGISPTWFSFFHVVSAFNNAGFSLLEGSMTYMSRDPVILLSLALLTCIGISFSAFNYLGNTFFPVFLRFVIFLFRSRSKNVVYYKYMLVHPSGTFKLLFPPAQTRTLAIALTLMLLFQTVWMLLFDWNNTFSQWNWIQRVVVAFFQSTSSRTSGFRAFDLSSFLFHLFIYNLDQLHMGVQFLLVLMMYIATYPFVVSDSSSILSITYDDEVSKVERNEEGKRIGEKQNSILVTLKAFFIFVKELAVKDSTWLVVAMLIICSVESERIHTDSRISFFKVVFEVISAYGNVGLSLGVPEVPMSFTSVLKPVSKWTILVVMLIGRCRELRWTKVKKPHESKTKSRTMNDQKEEEDEEEYHEAVNLEDLQV